MNDCPIAPVAEESLYGAFCRLYNEMLRRIEPEKIICYNTPFPEMQGNIVYVCMWTMSAARGDT